MKLTTALLALVTVCATAPCLAEEYTDRPLASSRRESFIRGHAECVKTYTEQFETSSAVAGDVADAALEACSSWMDDLKREIPSFEDRDTAVAKIESRARRISIKQVLETRLAASKK
jgi:hypothetical protein